MNHNDSSTGYPDPASSADNGPFYNGNNNARMGSDELQMAQQLSRGMGNAPIMPAPVARMTPDIHESQEGNSQNSANNQYEQSHMASPMQQPQQLQQQQLQQQQLQQQQQPNPYPMASGGGRGGDESTEGPPRKRSKVSRACDECRRKKIRCDATTETGEVPCANCKRTSATCQFSRVPQKRGPSKGYIKELADRLNQLEGAVHGAVGSDLQPYAPMHQDGGGSPRRVADEFSPSPNPQPMQSRIRSYSDMANDFAVGYPTPRPAAGWSHDTTRHLAPPAPTTSYQPESRGGDSAPAPYRSQFSPNGLAPQASWRPSPEAARRQDTSFNDNMADQNHAQEHAHGSQKVEWDENIIDGYYNTIQQYLPMLPFSKKMLLANLQKCQPNLRDAFLETLYATMRSFTSVEARRDGSGSRRADNLIASFQLETSARTMSSNLVLLHTLMLLAIETCNRAQPSPVTGPELGTMQAGQVSLCSAVGLAYMMKLHKFQSSDRFLESETDSDEKIARRTWWSLVIMDRWHASSSATPCLIPDTATVVLAEDQQLLGDITYHFTRLSIILGHVATVMWQNPDRVNPRVTPLVGILLTGELERFRESFPTGVTISSSPVLYMTYWHAKILMQRHTAQADPTGLLEPVLGIVGMLTEHSSVVTPWNHQLFSLAALTLSELMEYEETHDEAENALKALAQYRAVPERWNAAIHKIIGKALQSGAGEQSLGSGGGNSSQQGLIASQGLQHLADLAVGAEEGRENAFDGDQSQVTSPVLPKASPAKQQRTWDPTRITRDGFLNLVIMDPTLRG